MGELTRAQVIQILASAGKGANLRGVDLSSIDLKFLDFTEANLELANLSSANLFQAKLEKANLFMANLEYTDFSEADLQKAVLREANMIGADLRSANLGEADLRNTDLDRYSGWVAVGTFFEGIGTLVKFELIDPVMVYEMIGGMIFGYWNSRGLLIKEQQKVEPSYGEYIEYLHQEMVNLAKVRDPERDPYA